MRSLLPSVALSPGSPGLCHLFGGTAGSRLGDPWVDLRGPWTPFSRLALGLMLAQLTHVERCRTQGLAPSVFAYMTANLSRRPTGVSLGATSPLF